MLSNSRKNTHRLALVVLAATLASFGACARDQYRGPEKGLESVNGRRLNLLPRLDNLDSPLDFLPTWAAGQLQRWFPIEVILHSHPGSEISSDLDTNVEQTETDTVAPTAHLADNHLFEVGPSGSTPMVIIPERDSNKDLSECFDIPPLGGTCQEVEDMQFCNLAVIVANQICDESCGRCNSREKPLPNPVKNCDANIENVACEQEKQNDKKATESKPDESKSRNKENANESTQVVEEKSPENRKESTKCQNLGELIKSREDLSIMSALFEGAVHPLLKIVVDDSFVGTVFIPNNRAFEKFGNEVGISAEDILGGNPTFKDQIMDAHIVPGLPRRQFSPGQEFPTITARWDIFVEKEDDGIRLKSQSGFTASIIEQNISVCSSVVHIIDGLLLPMSKENAVSQLEESKSPTAG